MTQSNFFDDIARATVTLTQKGGKGVLVSGNLILTAAHCVNYTCDGAMTAMGAYFIEDIETAGGSLKATPVVVEPCCDIAVLGALDDQEFSEDFWAFEEFCEQT